MTSPGTWPSFGTWLSVTSPGTWPSFGTWLSGTSRGGAPGRPGLRSSRREMRALVGHLLVGTAKVSGRVRIRAAPVRARAGRAREAAREDARGRKGRSCCPGPAVPAPSARPPSARPHHRSPWSAPHARPAAAAHLVRTPTPGGASARRAAPSSWGLGHGASCGPAPGTSSAASGTRRRAASVVNRPPLRRPGPRTAPGGPQRELSRYA